MKIVVTGTRGIPDIMGGVETHCEELFPRIAGKGFDVTVIRRTNYVKDDLTEWKGSEEEIIRGDCPYFPGHQPGEKDGDGHPAYPCRRPGPACPVCKGTRYESSVHTPWSGLRPRQVGTGGENGAETRRKDGMHVR